MNIWVSVLQIGLAVLVPILTLWLESRLKIVRILSPVVICYGVGMLLGNQPWVAFSNEVSLTACNITVALAIPLLLFSVNIIAWLRLAKNTLLSFVFCMLSVMLVSAVAHLIFKDSLNESEKIAGMLVGVYTGGTPNMAAIGTALNVESNTFILLNAADMVVSFGYLFFILMVAGRLLKKIVPATQRLSESESIDAQADEKRIPKIKVIVQSLVLTVIIVAAGVGVGMLCPDSSKDAVTILIITTLAVVASLHPWVRSMSGTHDMGQFLLLVFCVAMGFTTDFAELFSSTSSIFLYVAVVLVGSVVVHFILGIIFRIDRDTLIITSAAGIFGPHMVGPVAMSLKNRDVIFSGLASGLVGYALGNYLGMGLAWILM
jgi:uncharacterized membrane protein